MKTIGVLALQGSAHLHQKALQDSGFATKLVRKPNELLQLDGLVMPGGETTALLKLMAPWDFVQAIGDFASCGKKVVGTCAGAILLAKKVLPQQHSIGAIDMTIERNAYGRQIDSFVGQSDTGNETLVFIRAPKITQVGKGVTVLLQHNGLPVLVRQANVMAATFHPEMAGYGVITHFLQS